MTKNMVIGRSVYVKVTTAAKAPALVQAIIEHAGDILAIVPLPRNKREVWAAFGTPNTAITHRQDIFAIVEDAWRENLG